MQIRLMAILVVLAAAALIGCADSDRSGKTSEGEGEGGGGGEGEGEGGGEGEGEGGGEGEGEGEGEQPDPIVVAASDGCAGAAVIPGDGFYTFAGSTEGMTADYRPEQRGPDVFYRFTTSASSSIIIRMEARPGWDTYIYLLGGSCAELVEVAYDDDAFGGEEDTKASELSLAELEAGDYFLVATGYDAESFGPFTMTVLFGEPVACGDGVCTDGWESSWSCPADCTCGNGECQADEGETLDTCPQDCAVCGDGVCTAGAEAYWECPEDCTCGDGECQADKGETHATCPADCAECGDGTCDYRLGERYANCAQDCLPPPPNDTCASAQGMPALGEVSVEATTVGAAPDHGRGGDVFYKITIGAASSLIALMSSPGGDEEWDTYLYLLKGPCDELVEVAQNDDYDGVGQSRIAIGNLEPGDYFLVASSFSSHDSGPFTLSLTFGAAEACGNGTCHETFESNERCPEDCTCGDGTCQAARGETHESCPADCAECGDGICEHRLGESNATCAQDCPPAPANDDCAGAAPLAAGQTVQGNTTSAAADYRQQSPDVFYRFTLAAAGPITLHMTTDPAWDTYLYLLRGSCDALEEVDRNDDWDIDWESGPSESLISLETLDAGDYYVVASGYDGTDTGPFDLSLTLEYTPEPEDPYEEWR